MCLHPSCGPGTLGRGAAAPRQYEQHPQCSPAASLALIARPRPRRNSQDPAPLAPPLMPQVQAFFKKAAAPAPAKKKASAPVSGARVCRVGGDGVAGPVGP